MSSPSAPDPWTDANTTLTAPSATTPEMIVTRQDLRVDTEWIQTGLFRIRRQIVSETRQIEITVRREVLTVDGIDLGTVDLGADGKRYYGIAPDGPVTEPPAGLAPLRITLREEVPEIVLHTVPYEQVSAHVIHVTGSTAVTETLARERVAVDIADSPHPVGQTRPYAAPKTSP